MAILVIWASPNTNGLTAAAKDRLLAGAASAGGECRVIHLNLCHLKTCYACGDGWGLCRSAGRCVIPDDFIDIYEKTLAADGLILVTPVYWHDLAECLKTLLDRLRRCETGHNHQLQGKPCLLVACAGGTGFGAIQCLDKLEQIVEHMGMETLDRLPVIRFNQSYMLPSLEGAGQVFAAHLRQRSRRPV